MKQSKNIIKDYAIYRKRDNENKSALRSKSSMTPFNVLSHPLAHAHVVT